MDPVALKKRTKEFAIRVLRLVDSLQRGRSEDILGRQLVRAATSIGADYRAACKARSRANFISKITIVEEEADETQYWLELLMELGKSDQPEITSSGKTAKRNR